MLVGFKIAADLLVGRPELKYPGSGRGALRGCSLVHEFQIIGWRVVHGSKWQPTGTLIPSNGTLENG